MKAGVKTAYLKARAEGASIRAAAKAAGVAKSTAQRWEQSLSSEISKLRAEHIESIAEEYALTRAARLEALGQLSERLKEDIAGRDLQEIPGDRIISLYLRTLREAGREAVPGFQVPEDPEDIQSLIAELLRRVSGGELTTEQSAVEVRAVATVIETHKTMVLQKKVEELAEVLDRLKTEMEQYKTGTKTATF